MPPESDPQRDPQTDLTETLNRLTDLTQEARAAARQARELHQPRTELQARHLAEQLDATRTRTLTEQAAKPSPERGDLNVEKALIVASTIELQGISTQLDSAGRTDLSRLQQLDPDAVLDWLDWHAVRLYPHQRRAIERAAA